MGKSFEGIYACSTGRFEDGNGEKIPQWIRNNGGQYSKAMHTGVTHLITTKEAFLKDAPAGTTDIKPTVLEAKNLNKVKIVTFDWLEDSLLSKSKRPRNERAYLLANILKAEKIPKKGKRKADQLQNQSKRPKGWLMCGSAPQGVFTHIYFSKQSTHSRSTRTVLPRSHPYVDPDTGETWRATLLRQGPPPQYTEKYLIQLFETDAKPHTYSTYVKYSRIGISRVETLAPPKSKLDIATTTFKMFFKTQTGKEWEERENGLMPPPKTDSEDNVLPSHQGWYHLEVKGSMLMNWLMKPIALQADAQPGGDRWASQEGQGIVSVDSRSESSDEEQGSIYGYRDGDWGMEFDDENGMSLDGAIYDE
ncbi:hypothetical protein N7474_002144 [Penicillium riverlandense]|uniref:uncharacterized protein n=1 Tax=Penicillium riverlandense TaxID=1903569 RepID=UPI0025479DC8|nr:uncharacterized protein N7474_002144 [Penicillium riverlandense]KAJ5833833.1 hypothetical protein N7474_002144 [Penicillium riverlandense]